MSISRRNFLRDAGTAALATAAVQLGATGWLLGDGALGPSSALAGGVGLSPRVLDRVASLPRAAFAGCVSKWFKLRPPRAAVQKVVLEAVEDGVDPRQASVECFSLRFRGAAGAPSVGQGTYLLSSPELGRFGLFLVPMGDDGLGPRYEAVINRLAA